MNTYTKGVWSEDATLSDDWSISSDIGLQYKGYETITSASIGLVDAYNIAVYDATEESEAKYPYFVSLQTVFNGVCVLVSDFSSLMMLIKEYAPIIELYMKVREHHIMVEEHQWKAKLMKEEHSFKCECAYKE